MKAETLEETQSIGWRAEQKILLKQRLYDVALELFRRQGFTKTTMQQIADEAGVAKGTFFNYFRSKDHILWEWYQQITKTALTNAANRDYATFAESLLAFTDDLTLAATTEKELWRAKASSTFSGPVLLEGECTLDDEVIDFCCDLIVKGKQLNEIDQKLEPRFFAELYISVLTGTGHIWVIANQESDLQQMTRKQVDFMIQAILV